MRAVPVTVVGISLLLLLTGCAWGPRSSASQDYRISDPFTTVVVTGDDMDVTIRSGEGPATITERRLWRHGGAAPATRREVVDGRLEVAASACDGCEVTLTVTVPKSTRAEVRLTNGELFLRDLSGDAAVVMDTGDVTGSGLGGASYHVAVDSGRVELRYASSPASVVATVDTGEVDVRVPPGIAYAVRSDRGLSTVDVQRDPASPHTIEVNVSTGHAVVLKG